MRRPGMIGPAKSAASPGDWPSHATTSADLGCGAGLADIVLMCESEWKDPFMPGAATVVDLLAAKPGTSLPAGSALSGGKAVEAGAGFATILKSLVPPQDVAGVGVTISAAGAGVTTGAAGAGQPTPAMGQAVSQQMTGGAPTDTSVQPIAAAPVQPMATDDGLNVAAPVSPMSKTAAKLPALAVQDVRRRSDQPAAKAGHDAQPNPPAAITGLADPTVAIPAPPPPAPPAPAIPVAADPAGLPAAAGVVAADAPPGQALAPAGAVNTAPAASPPVAKERRGEIAAAPMKTTTEQASSAAAPTVPVVAMSDMQASGHAQAGLGAAAALAPSPPLRGAGASATPSTPAPAEQVAASIARLGNASSQTLIVRLNPGELGHVQITIARPNDGPASVALVAERPETLLLLLRDQPHLNQALNQAGIPSEARTLTFDLATPRTEGAPAGGGQGSGQSSNQPTMDFGASREDRGRQDNQWQGEPAAYRGLGSPLDATFALTDAAPARITGLVGLNITA
jgi:flagellar hook-length control protein FliK